VPENCGDLMTEEEGGPVRYTSHLSSPTFQIIRCDWRRRGPSVRRGEAGEAEVGRRRPEQYIFGTELSFPLLALGSGREGR